MLQKEDELNEIVQLVGKDALAETDKIVLETARWVLVWVDAFQLRLQLAGGVGQMQAVVEGRPGRGMMGGPGGAWVRQADLC